jgi:hypothetical protein
MDREDIIRMAREAGCKPFRSPEYWDDVQVFATPDVLERFAALVAASEREACAKAVEDYCGAWDDEGYALATAIRARGDKE